MRVLSRTKLKNYCGKASRNEAYGRDQIEYLCKRFTLDLIGTKQVFASVISRGLTDEALWHNGVHRVLYLLETFSSTTAESERGFSEMNRVQTKERSRLTAKRTSSLMTLSLVTPASLRFNPVKFLPALEEKFSPYLKREYIPKVADDKVAQFHRFA